LRNRLSFVPTDAIAAPIADWVSTLPDMESRLEATTYAKA
jgi:hypothetical protein